MLFVFALLLGFDPPAIEDPLIKNLVWNRYITTNFTILSIDNDQGYWMKNNLEDIKIWCLTRWGFSDIKFSKECRIFCVPNKNLLKKLFNLDSSKIEIRKKNDEIEITAMWLVLDDKPSKVLPIYLTEIILAEFESSNLVKLPLWSKKGMSSLNGMIDDIKLDLSNLSNVKIYDIQTILNMNEQQFVKLGQDKQKLFINQSVALCLLLRKEFGELKLHSFLKTSFKSGSNESVKKVLGFKDYSDFEKTYVRYIDGLSKDITNKVIPDSYLQIKKIER
ncbi:MAG: hypothetical protein WCJ72_13535 [Chryseobacterium sp.]